MKYYPAFLDIRGRRCVVVGGGDVAERKVSALLDCGADVIVVGPLRSKGLATLKAGGRIGHVDDEYRPDHLEGAFIVFGATGSPEVNNRVARDSRERGILVNIVDDPERCGFIVPAVLNRGSLTIAVSTAGKSPALARRIREEMEGQFGGEYAVLVEIMGLLRKTVLAHGEDPDDNRKIFERLLDAGLIEMIRQKRWDEATDAILEITGERIEPWDEWR
ncbi:MAG: bifunctional precorrin-2 dehydrogenase/sirohydrochlorin ferrochelatase [Deltaproteobacteria bacterium]|nr:bifunctional precorrin-2 dehydrogenase/sirohydrochlorin ferrochelatase [Deltaproteobacteria bacterium]